MFTWFKLKKRISDLEETVKRLDQGMKDLDHEWTETYDKFRHLHMRIAKRMQRAGEQISSQEEAPGGGSDNHSIDTSRLSLLTPAQRRIQEQILARRSRGVITKEGEG